MAKWRIWKDEYDGELKWCLQHHSLCRVYKFDTWDEAHAYVNAYKIGNDPFWADRIEQTYGAG